MMRQNRARKAGSSSTTITVEFDTRLPLGGRLLAMVAAATWSGITRSRDAEPRVSANGLLRDPNAAAIGLCHLRLNLADHRVGVVIRSGVRGPPGLQSDGSDDR